MSLIQSPQHALNVNLAHSSQPNNNNTNMQRSAAFPASPHKRSASTLNGTGLISAISSSPISSAASPPGTPSTTQQKIGRIESTPSPNYHARIQMQTMMASMNVNGNSNAVANISCAAPLASTTRVSNPTITSLLATPTSASSSSHSRPPPLRLDSGGGPRSQTVKRLNFLPPPIPSPAMMSQVPSAQHQQVQSQPSSTVATSASFNYSTTSSSSTQPIPIPIQSPPLGPLPSPTSTSSNSLPSHSPLSSSSSSARKFFCGGVNTSSIYPSQSPPPLSGSKSSKKRPEWLLQSGGSTNTQVNGPPTGVHMSGSSTSSLTRTPTSKQRTVTPQRTPLSSAGRSGGAGGGSAAGSGARAQNNTPTSDRFIPSRKLLPRAILSGHAMSYQDSPSHSSSSNANKENPSSTDEASPPKTGLAALQEMQEKQDRSAWKERMAEMMDLPAGMELQQQQQGNGKQQENNKKKNVSRVLFPSASASSISSSSSTTDNGNSHHASTLHQAQLNQIYRSTEGTAASSYEDDFSSFSLSSSTHSPSSRSNHNQLPSSSPHHSPPQYYGTPLNPQRQLYLRQATLPTESARVLDCPGLLNDFYLNLLHWNSRSGVVAIALGADIYLWNQHTTQIDSIPQVYLDSANVAAGVDEISSLRWNEDGTILAVGYKSSTIRLYDSSTKALLHSYTDSHTQRVSCLDWNTGGSGAANQFASGGLDTTVKLHDIRVSSSTSSSNIIASYTTHREEVCGLSFSLDGMQLASGANDNKLCIWNLRASNNSSASSSSSSSSSPHHLTLRHHRAAVKALSWCPWDSRLLASGGGLMDGHIRFCDPLLGTELSHTIETKSQISSLQWNTQEKELLSAHGHPDYTLNIWKYPSLQRLTSLKGHTARILHTSISPDHSTVVSAAADETLRFWKVWKPQMVEKKKETKMESWIRTSPMHKMIR